MPKNKQKNPLVLLIVVLFIVFNIVGSFFNSKATESISSLIFFVVIFLIMSSFKKDSPKIKDFFGKIAEAGKQTQDKKPISSQTTTVSSNNQADSLINVLGQLANVNQNINQEVTDKLPTGISQSRAVLAIPPVLPTIFSSFFGQAVVKKLERNKKYLQVALNGSLGEAKRIIRQLPVSERIIIEAGTPLIKIYGARAIREISFLAPSSYIVADSKTADLAEREVIMAREAGASAITCLGVAPIETIDEFITACQNQGLDSMIDMMNVESPLLVLKKLKNLPQVVILHRGVDETEFNKEKMIPYYQINQIKGSFNVLLSVAGGDTPNEIQSAVFNGADIVVVWKNFMQAGAGVAALASSFLKEVK